MIATSLINLGPVKHSRLHKLLSPGWIHIHLRVPTRTGKPGKMREIFSVGEKLGNFKILLESRGILYKSWKIRSDNKKKNYGGESLQSVVSRHIFVDN